MIPFQDGKTAMNTETPDTAGVGEQPLGQSTAKRHCP